MPILYLIRKKIDKSGINPKELYYAVPKTIQKRGEPVNEVEIADNLAHQSSVMAGDVLSVLQQLPHEIAEQLKSGRTIHIRGFGTFYMSISSKGVEKPEDCRPSTIVSSRICFRADVSFKKLMSNCEFVCVDDLDTKNTGNE